MINKRIRLLALAVILGASLHAQSIADGVKELYNDNYAGARTVFEKQADKPEATYWLVRSYLQENNVTAAQQALDKAAAKANDPWVLVAKGYVQLTNKQVNEATQSFEAAITASKGKKNNDPEILNAIGAAITTVYNNRDKVGDINYAVQKLEEAKNITQGMKKNEWLKADVLTNLGDAYRKAKPGDGTAAFSAYQDATFADPNFAPAYYRTAFIFKSQRNYDLYTQNLEKAIEVDPKFIPAYDALFMHKLQTLDNAGALAIANKIVENAPPGPDADYYKASALYVNKDYDQAITAAKAIAQKYGADATPKVYRLMAWATLEKKDTAGAVPYVDDFFAKAPEDMIQASDYNLKAQAYSAVPGKEQDILKAYMDGLEADTVLENRLKLLNDGAQFFRNKGQFSVAGDLYAKLLEIKPDPIINDYFNAGYFGYYQGKEYEKSWKIFDAARTKFPDQNYGYVWTFNNSRIFDSANEKNLLVPDAEKLITFSQTDTAKEGKTNLYNAAYTLAVYYNDIKSDKVNGLKYLTLAAESAPDPQTKQQLSDIVKQLGGEVKNGAAGTPATDSTGTPAPATDSTQAKTDSTGTSGGQ